MFAHDYRWIDVGPYLAAGEQPVYLLERPLAHGTQANAGIFSVAEVARVGEYWVPTCSLLDDKINWSVCQRGEHVRVPVFAYRTSRSLAALWGLGLQLGAAAVASLAANTRAPILGLTLILGHECHDLLTAGDDAYRGYAGIALRVK